jgi:hypothetical protein
MLSNKTVKMPLRFRQPMTTGLNLLTSSQKVLEFLPPLLPKGWVYKVEDVNVKTEAKVASPSSYQLTDTPCYALLSVVRLGR